jgi:hypothetical protein
MKPAVKRKKMTNAIKAAAENTLKVANVKATVIVTPSTISFEDIANKADADVIESAFAKGGMKSLGVCDLSEIDMGTGYSVTIAY